MDILILILKCAISFTDADFVKVFDNRIEEPEIRMYTLTKGGFMIRYVDGDFSIMLLTLELIQLIVLV